MIKIIEESIKQIKAKDVKIGDTIQYKGIGHKPLTMRVDNINSGRGASPSGKLMFQQGSSKTGPVYRFDDLVNIVVSTNESNSPKYRLIYDLDEGGTTYEDFDSWEDMQRALKWLRDNDIGSNYTTASLNEAYESSGSHTLPSQVELTYSAIKNVSDKFGKVSFDEIHYSDDIGRWLYNISLKSNSYPTYTYKIFGTILDDGSIGNLSVDGAGESRNYELRRKLRKEIDRGIIKSEKDITKRLHQKISRELRYRNFNIDYYNDIYFIKVYKQTSTNRSPYDMGEVIKDFLDREGISNYEIEYEEWGD